MRLAAALLLVALAPRRADATPEAEWILTLANGDVLHCQLRAIEADRLVVVWAVAPDEPLKLDLAAVSHVAREGKDGGAAEPPSNQDILRLLDDSVLYGRAVSIAPTGIEFEVPQVGRLLIPAADIVDLQRGRQEVQLPEARDGEFAVATRSGVALSGKLVADDRGRLVLEGAGVTATIDYDSLAALAFPRPTLRAADTDAPPVAGIEIKLRNGSVIAGKSPALDGGILRLKTGGIEARVPTADIASISFREYGPPLGRSGLRTMLVWGRWSDPAEELPSTMEIVKAETQGRWRIIESTAEKYDDAFRSELLAARTLLIPEMEKLPTPPTDAGEMKPLLEAFLRSGGNVVVCGPQGHHLQWMKDAGLTDLGGAGQVDGAEVTLTPKGAALCKGIKAFPAMNATNTYVIQAADTFAIAEAGGKAVVVGRRVGRGYVIVVGSDYYSTNEGSSKLLGQMIQVK